MPLVHLVLTPTQGNGLRPAHLHPQIAKLDQTGRKIYTRGGLITTRYIEWNNSDVNKLKEYETIKWSNQAEFYNNLTENSKKFWNAVKKFCNAECVCVSYHYARLDEGHPRHFHILWNSSESEGRWHDKAIYRGIRAKAAPACMNVYGKRVTDSTAAKSNVMGYMFKLGKTWLGCNSRSWLIELLAYREWLNDTDTFGSCTSPSFCVSIEEDDLDFIGDGIANPTTSATDLALLGIDPTSADFEGMGPPATDAENDDGGNIVVPALKRPSNDPIVNGDPTPNYQVTKKQRVEEPSKTKSEVMVDFLFELCKKYSVRDYNSLLKKISENDDLAAKQQLIRTHMSPTFNKVMATVATLLDCEVQGNGQTYYELFMNADFSDSSMSKADSFQLFMEWCEEFQLDYWMILVQVWAIMKMFLPKRNCFTFYGASNAGKSFWIEKCFLRLPDLVGRTTTQDQFMYEMCVKTPIIHMNEVELISKAQIDKFKEVSEGTPTAVSVKFQGTQIMGRKPVFYTSNTCPWSRCTGADRDALQNRMFAYQLNKESAILSDLDKNGTTTTNPHFAKPFFELFDQWEGNEPDELQEIFENNEMNFDQLEKVDQIYQSFLEGPGGEEETDSHSDVVTIS